MARRGAALWLAVLLAASLATSAGQASILPVVARDHDVVAVDVPLAPDGSGSLQVPVAGGILDLRVEPVLLAGPGGAVDVQAYVAHALLLLPDGVSVPLPSMVILPESRAIDGPAGQALADLAADVERMRSAIDDLQAEDPQDPVLAQLQDLQEEIAALAAEAQWVQAFADEAAATASAGAAEQVAIASAMLARVEAGLALVQEGLDRVAAQASGLVPVPSMTLTPSPAPTTSPPSSSAAPTTAATSTSPPAPPPGPDLEEAIQPLLDEIAAAQALAAEALATAEQARADLEGMADGAIAFVDERVPEQAILDGVAWALAKAQADLGKAKEGAEGNVSGARSDAQQSVSATRSGAEGSADDAWRDAEEDMAAARANVSQSLADLRLALDERGQETNEWGVAQAEAAVASLQQLAADLAWAEGWVAAVQNAGPPLLQQSLEDAARSIAAAQATAQAMRDLLYDYSPPEGQTAADLLAAKVAEAEATLPAEVQAARQDAAEALAGLPALVGGLEPMPDADVDDSDGLAVCLDAAASAVCVAYVSPAASTSLGSLTVLVALPVGSVGLDLPAGLEGVSSSLSSTLSSVPLPTSSSSPTLPPLPLPTGLPGGSTSASPSPSPSSSASASSSASSSSASSSSASSSSSSASSSSASSSSSSSSSSAPPKPHLVIEADRDAMSLAMGAQGAIVVKVRNDGNAADRVRLTSQTDAPVTVDSPTAALDLAPGAVGNFTVRVTPLRAGSGALDLLATGDVAGTVRDSVAITIAAAAPAPASIAASLEPAALEGAVGQAMQVTLRLVNNGPVADRVVVQLSGTNIDAEPSRIEVLLQPAESAVREVQITALQEGSLDVVLGVTSTRGADLRPLLLVDAAGVMEGSSVGPGAGDDEEDKPKDKSKAAPAAGIAFVAAAIVVAVIGVRRRLEK